MGLQPLSASLISRYSNLCSGDGKTYRDPFWDTDFDLSPHGQPLILLKKQKTNKQKKPKNKNCSLAPGENWRKKKNYPLKSYLVFLFIVIIFTTICSMCMWGLVSYPASTIISICHRVSFILHCQNSKFFFLKRDFSRCILKENLVHPTIPPPHPVPSSVCGRCFYGDFESCYKLLDA